MKYISQSIFYILFFCLSANNLIQAQYQFEDTKRLACTAVKNQQKTGTCWSYATVSLLESELYHLNEDTFDISEMFIVRNVYLDKARNYVLRQGKANFSQGSLSHDMLRVADEVGLLPQSAYEGNASSLPYYDHGALEEEIKTYLDSLNTLKVLPNGWLSQVDSILDKHMGPVPETFEYNGKKHSVKTFTKTLGLDLDDYAYMTSFTHHPFYENFIIEIPDNYSNGEYYNVPIEQLLSHTKKAVDMGYTVAWDGDVSEPGFSAKEGIAVLPVDETSKDIFKGPVEEIEVTQELRQELFENKVTTDDHLMHIVGSASDQNGKYYFIVKNSWGELSDYKGYLYMSEAYFKLKTVAVVFNSDPLAEPISN